MKNRDLIEKLQSMDLDLEVGVINPDYLYLEKDVEPRLEIMTKGYGSDPFLYSDITTIAKKSEGNKQEVIVLW